MNRYALLIPTFLTMLSCWGAKAQTTIHVPADASTIQSAIDTAKNGDTVLVSPGTYNENLDFKGKAITVTTGATSFADATTVIVNGTADGPVVNFATNEPASAVLNGFTLQGGHSNSLTPTVAGGIFISDASPTITNNIVLNNFGCGIYIVNLASPLIQGNDIKGTRRLSSADTQCNTSYGPATDGTGIGIAHAGTVQIIGNTIEDNSQYDVGTADQGSGAGVYINAGSEVLLQNNIIRNNLAFAGSGLDTSIPPTKLILIQNLFYGNTGANGGDASPVQVIIEGTSSAPYPALIEINNTIAGAGGGQLITNQAVSSTIANNLFIDTVSVLNPSTQSVYAGLACEGNNEFTNNNNDIFNEGVPVPSECPSGAGLLSVDPQFVNPTTFDFHTERTSPVVAAGDINAPMIPPTDLYGKNRTVCGTIDMGVYEVHPIPPIALTVAPNPAPGQSSVTLTATLTGNCNTPTGLITFMDGGTVLGTATLNGSAVATFSTSFLFVGTHNLTVTYPGDFNFAPSTSNTITEVITGPPTTTILNSVSPNPALPLQPITMTATVTSAYTTPAGTITFMTGGKTLVTATLAANGTASATISTLGAGTYPITAVYGGSTEYAGSPSNTVIEVVNGAPTTTALTSAPNPSTFGQTVTFTATVAAPQSTTTPTGTVTFMDGATTLGSAPLSTSDVAQFSTAALAGDSHNITAVYGGSTNDNKSTSNTVVQIVNINTAAIDLTASPNPAQVGQAVTLTVSASGIMWGATTDTVTFYDGSNSIGSAPLNAAGVASISTSSLTLGTHSITATLAATTTHTSATSAPVSEVIIQAGFSFTGSSITLLTGRSGTGNLQLASLQGFTGNVAITCNPPFPPNYTCSLQYPSISLTPNLTRSFTYTLHTSYTASAAPSPPFDRSTRIVLASLFPLTLLSLTGLARTRRRTHLRKLLALTCLAILASATTACGPDRYIEATSPGTYPITFTAIGTNQGSSTSISHTLTINVILNQ